MLSPKIIALEEGWNNEIKAKAIDVLEEMLNNGFDQKSQRLFAPKEYVQTCVAPRPALGRVAPSVRKGSFRARRPAFAKLQHVIERSCALKLRSGRAATSAAIAS